MFLDIYRHIWMLYENYRPVHDIWIILDIPIYNGIIGCFGLGTMVSGGKEWIIWTEKKVLSINVFGCSLKLLDILKYLDSWWYFEYLSTFWMCFVQGTMVARGREWNDWTETEVLPIRPTTPDSLTPANGINRSLNVRWFKLTEREIPIQWFAFCQYVPLRPILLHRLMELIGVSI